MTISHNNTSNNKIRVNKMFENFETFTKLEELKIKIMILKEMAADIPVMKKAIMAHAARLKVFDYSLHCYSANKQEIPMELMKAIISCIIKMNDLCYLRLGSQEIHDFDGDDFELVRAL
eukprot:CAMPEP_0114586612 /NCGR_PEP_ID=MMETSP0125-20121206/9781_1 /TAXON_ID=485358 ORGANISM="Aristerostoma sp., Strain ATCC 50986" /NCGR_SAMPLE_ID=MMETSP0125 /ASSEMBLY_ACC=CAM_ASM_000245 /LENGTH=118 /DNA_ID=CAMNT_0001782115 /DNA_START=1337 /DNA_END=1693 /DNA_ORIENTATION=+